MLVQNGHLDERDRPGIGAECIRRLHPRRQLDYGVGSIVYLAAWTTSVAEAYLWLAGRPSAGSILAVSLVLWCCSVAGTWLSVVLEVDEPKEEVRLEIEHERAERRVSA